MTLVAPRKGPLAGPITGARGRWLLLTLLAAAIVTAIDAALLERKEGLFGGGFLAVDPLDTMVRRIAFFGASILSDAAVAGVLVALVLWAGRRLALSRVAASFLALVMAPAPLVIVDFVNFELGRYLGDAIDLSLMFDLAGRRPSEFLAVAGPNLIVPVLGILLGAAFVTLAAHWLHRRGRGPERRLTARVGWRTPVILFAVGAIVLGTARVQSAALDNGLRRKPSGQLIGWLITTVSDVDRDGYGLLGRPADPAPFDARVYPYAVDVPGNGVDENGLAGDLPADWPAYAEDDAPVPFFAHRPLAVVLIVLESFRADAVGAWVNGRPVTPVLDTLAREGMSSARAYSHNGYTAQSRYHLLTGSLARLRDGTSLIDDFKQNGYEVAYISGQDESFGGARFSVGFERADFRYDARMSPERRYSTFTTAGSLAVPFDVVLEQAERFLGARNAGRPLFLYANFHDTHFPYHHRGMRTLVSDARLARGLIAPERAAELSLTYMNSAANVDRAIGLLLEQVERAVGAAPAVIVTSDHGESLFDEGFLGHGYALNDVQTRVPFVAARLPLRIVEPFGQVELRGALRDALSRPGGGPPSLGADPEKVVFQYLGSSVDRPRQVGERGLNGRITFDFRSVRASAQEGAAGSRPSEVRPGDIQRLLRDWEAMVWAMAQAVER